jgi:hypothetical protein
MNRAVQSLTIMGRLFHLHGTAKRRPHGSLRTIGFHEKCTISRGTVGDRRLYFAKFCRQQKIFYLQHVTVVLMKPQI